MFSVRQKREISEAVQLILRRTGHPELTKDGEIPFTLAVHGAAPWSFAEIKNNGRVTNPLVNPHNERQDPLTANIVHRLALIPTKPAVYGDQVGIRFVGTCSWVGYQLQTASGVIEATFDKTGAVFTSNLPAEVDQWFIEMWALHRDGGRA